jgi:hypothetical protein
MSSISTSISSITSVTVAGSQVPDLVDFLTVYFFSFLAFFFRIFIRFDYFFWASGFSIQTVLASVILTIFTILYFSISSSTSSLLSDPILTKVSPATKLDYILTSFLRWLLIFLLYSVLAVYSQTCSSCSLLYYSWSTRILFLKVPRQSRLSLFKYIVPIAI